MIVASNIDVCLQSVVHEAFCEVVLDGWNGWELFAFGEFEEELGFAGVALTDEVDEIAGGVLAL